ncbi:bcl-2/adenovirus E1B 19 kDa-interacting protein 2-like protein [Pungitius pungitius]|uniref:bcl-2/adenovirus E1B 19 kDa-interacting protein 2-like protein n=1 Tax=Pungitius pungitius TaxID=134920 RepID=UPI002E0D35E5
MDAFGTGTTITTDTTTTTEIDTTCTTTTDITTITTDTTSSMTDTFPSMTAFGTGTTSTDTPTTGTASSTSPPARTPEDGPDEEQAGEQQGEQEEAPSGTEEAPPTSVLLSQPTKKKVLLAPALSLSLGRSESTVSSDFPSTFLSPPPEDDDDVWLDLNLDAMETPSDSGSLPFPIYDPEDDMQRLGVASRRRRPPRDRGPRSRFDFQGGSGESDQSEPADLERDDVVDGDGTRWRCFSGGDPSQERWVNMSLLEPFLRVLSHGGYYGDGMYDVILFSSCYLPQNRLENYQKVMDHLFRYVVGTLDLMVAENYVMVYLCAGGQKDNLPGISWLRDGYTTINRRLRKNLKGFYVVHPTWYIKALITIIKPFISSKFRRKLHFVGSLQDLGELVPSEHVQVPDCVSLFDQSLSR